MPFPLSPGEDRGHVEKLTSPGREGRSDPLLPLVMQANASIANRSGNVIGLHDHLSQKCHHVWIEAFLVSHREVRSAEQHR